MNYNLKKENIDIKYNVIKKLFAEDPNELADKKIFKKLWKNFNLISIIFQYYLLIIC